MKQVFVVTSGTYSEYHIEGIFSTGARAESYVLAIGITSDAKVETWKVDANIEKVDRGLSSYLVTMDKAGAVRQVRNYTPRHLNHDWISGPQTDFYEASMWARDEEHAIKIANERRVIILALGQWKHGRVKLP